MNELLWKLAFELARRGQIPEQRIVLRLWRAQLDKMNNLFRIINIPLDETGEPVDYVLFHCDMLLTRCLEGFDNRDLIHILKVIHKRHHELRKNNPNSQYGKAPEWLTRDW